MNGISYEIDELLNEAVMTGVPVLLVEGIDDVSIYSDLVKRVPFDVEIYAVENIEGFGEGCDQVILAIEALNALNSNDHPLSKHILGVIDKDVKDFRGELPSAEPILVLNYYSIESHFISKAVVKNILDLTSKINKELITDSLCELIMSEIEEKLLDLYYFSLESLKKSLDAEYNASFSYSYSCGRIKDQSARLAINSKSTELDCFALTYNLSPTLSTLKCITKGKWLIDVFSEELIECINNLQDKCRNNVISSCRSCVAQTYNKCLYRMKNGFTKNTIQSLALANVIGDDFDYIVEKISLMKKCA